jgi:hypothetical protein
MGIDQLAGVPVSYHRAEEDLPGAVTVLEIYRAQCKANVHPAPDVIGA